MIKILSENFQDAVLVLLVFHLIINSILYWNMIINVLSPLTQKLSFIETSEIEAKCLVFKESINIALFVLLNILYITLSVIIERVAGDLLFTILVLLISMYVRYMLNKLHPARLNEEFNADRYYCKGLRKLNLFLVLFMLVVTLINIK